MGGKKGPGARGPRYGKDVQQKGQYYNSRGEHVDGEKLGGNGMTSPARGLRQPSSLLAGSQSGKNAL